MKKIFWAVAAFLLLTTSVAHAEGLAIQKLLFADQIAGLGQYTPKADTRFTLDDTCRVYVEVAGFSMPLTLNTQDEYNVNLAVDVRIRLPQSRRQVAAQADMATFDSKLRTKLTNYFFPIGFNFNGWSPGSYLLEITVRDNLANQAVSQELSFTLVEPTEADTKARQEREALQQEQTPQKQPGEEQTQETAP